MGLANRILNLNQSSQFVTDVALDASLKATVLLAITALAALMLRKSSAAIRHRIWCLGLCGACLIPLFSLTLPQWRLAILPPTLPDEALNEVQSAPADAAVADIAAPEVVPPEAVVVEPSQPDLIAADALRPTTPIPDQALESSGMDESELLPADVLPINGAENILDVEQPTEVIAETIAESPQYSARDALAAAWVLGAALVLIPLAFGLLANCWLQIRSRRLSDTTWTQLLDELAGRLKLSRPVKLLQAGKSVVPMTWGVLRPIVFLPDDTNGWSAARRRFVLLHELAHVKRMDVLFQSIARVACALYWFNPLMWYALRRLRIERELACDDCVVATGVRATDYASQLLEIARTYRPARLSIGVAMSRKSKLEHRIVAMLDQARSHLPVGKRIGRCLIAAALIVVVGLSVIGLEEARSIEVDLPAESDEIALNGNDLEEPTDVAANPEKDTNDSLPLPDENALSRFATTLAERFRTRLPFTSPNMKKRVSDEVHEIVVKYGSAQDLTDDFQKALLDSLDGKLSRIYPNGPQLNDPRVEDEAYLNLPTQVRNLQWKLFMAIRRRPLDDGAQARLDAQRAWMRKHIRSLPAPESPVTEGNSHADKIAELEAKFADPLCPIFHEPLEGKQFARLQKDMEEYIENDRQAKQELLFVVPHLVWADFSNRFGRSRSMIPAPSLKTWDAEPIGRGQTNGVTHVSFHSAEIHQGNRNTISGYHESQMMVDVSGNRPGLRSFDEMPGENATIEELDDWFAEQRLGHLIFDEQEQRLIGVRGTKLVPLQRNRWAAIDQILTKQLISRIENEGSRFWPLPKPTSKNDYGELTFDSMAAVKTAEGKVFVIRLIGLGPAGLKYHIRRHNVVNPANLKLAMVNPTEPPKLNEAANKHTIRGRVVDSDGKPVAGAKVHFLLRRNDLLSRGLPSNVVSSLTTDEQGRFAVSAPQFGTFAIANGGSARQGLLIFATAKGFGPDWQPIGKSDRKEITLKLVKDTVPLMGHLVDLEGQPAANVRVRIRSMSTARSDLGQWIAKAQHNPAQLDRNSMSMYRAVDRDKMAYFPVEKNIALAGTNLLPDVMTDQQGRFEISGVGPDRWVSLEIEGPNIAKSRLSAVTRSMKPINYPTHDPRFRSQLAYGAEFTYAVEPSQVISGVVRDVDSKEPLANARIVLYQYAESLLDVQGFLSTITNERGEYQLTGIPKPANPDRKIKLRVLPAADQPYFRTEVDVPKLSGLDPVELDIDLKRGVWITGQVKDAETGKPLPAHVSYYPRINNPHAEKYRNFIPGRTTLGYDSRYATDEQGRYRIPAIPGTGVVVAIGFDGGEYRAAVGADELGWKSNPRMRTKFVYHLHGPELTNAVQGVDIAPNDKQVNADLELMPFDRQSVGVVDPDGKPLRDVNILIGRRANAARFVQSVWSQQRDKEPVDSPLEIVGLQEDGRRLLVLSHPARKLGGAAIVETGKNDSITLQPLASISGRLLDSTGRPLGEKTIRADVLKSEFPNGETGSRRINRRWIQYAVTDAKGYFHLDAIVPGIRYEVSLAPGDKLTDTGVVAAGEKIDLGDLKLDDKGEDRQTGKSPKRPRRPAADPKTDSKKRKDTKDDRQVIRGRVLDPSGQPVQADVWLAGPRRQEWNVTPQPKVQWNKKAKSDADGRFSIPWERNQPRENSNDLPQKIRLVATAPGLGFAWADVEAGKLRNEVTLQLVKDKPIEGRIVTADGTPVPGVKLSVVDIYSSKATVEEILKNATRSSGVYTNWPGWLGGSPTSRPVVTDAEGRFRLEGLGSQRFVRLQALGGGMAATRLAIHTREAPASRPNGVIVVREGLAESAYFARFTHVAVPGRSLQGIVTDAKSGKPVSGVQLVASTSWASRKTPAVTGADGRFQIDAVPKADQYRVEVRATKSLHFNKQLTVADTGGLEPIAVNVPLSQGIRIRGRVTDAETGKPVRGKVDYEALWPNVNVRTESKQTRIGDPASSAVIDDEGNYELSVFPGAGVIAVQVEGGRYSSVTVEADDVKAIVGKGGMSTIRGKQGVVRFLTTAKDVGVAGPMALNQYHAIQLIKPADKPDAITVDLQVTPSRSRPGTILDEQGQPLAGADAIGLGISGTTMTRTPLDSEKIMIDGLMPGRSRTLLFMHREHHLGAKVVVAGDEMTPVTVRMSPTGTITGRLVDADGDPLGPGTVTLSPHDPPLIGTGYWDAELDGEGRFEIGGLIKDCPYRVELRLSGSRPPHYITGDVKVDSGETLNLGEFKQDRFDERRFRPVKKPADDTAAKAESAADNTADSNTADSKTAISQASEAAETPDKDQVAIANQKEANPSAGSGQKQSHPRADSQTNSENKPKAENDELVYRGRVLDPDGKPSAGAKVFLAYWSPNPVTEESKLAPAMTNADGEFVLKTSISELQQMSGNENWKYASLIAMREGYGFASGVAPLFEQTGKAKRGSPPEQLAWLQMQREKHDGILRLVRDDAPLKGRVIDTDGQPIAGARIHLDRIWMNHENSLDAWEKHAEGPDADFYSLRQRTQIGINGPQLAAELEAATTAQDGRFEFRGLGRERVVKLLISGPGMETMHVHARTRPGKRIELPMQRRGGSGRKIVYHGTEFTHVGGPSKPVVGRVTDLETGQPVPGLLIQSDSIASLPNWTGQNHIRTVTDADGHYRLEGLPIGNNSLVIVPQSGQPYAKSAFRVNTKSAEKQITHDAQLRKGVRVHGRITDGRTGKPVAGTVEYFAFFDEKTREEYPGFRFSGRQTARSDNKGQYQIVVLPGAGIITFNADEHRKYQHGVGTKTIEGQKQMAGTMAIFATEPRRCISSSHHLLTAIHPKKDQQELAHNLELASGIEIVGKVVDPDGRPVSEFLLRDGSNLGGWHLQRGGTFTARGYEPGKSLRLLFYEPSGNLAAKYTVTGKPPANLQITLEPAGSLKGRLVDKDGGPIPDVRFIPGRTADANAADFATIPPEYPGRQQHTDADGHFHLKGLLPGMKYAVRVIGTRKLGGQQVSDLLGELPLQEIEIKPGKTIELGDVKLREENQQNDPRKPKRKSRPDANEIKKPSKQSISLKPQSAAPHKLIRGTVNGPDGKPAAAALVAIVARSRKGSGRAPGEILVEGETDSEGRYRFSLPNVSSKSHRLAALVVRTEDSAIAWQDLDLDAKDAKHDFQLRPQQLMQIRFVDIEGRPAANLRAELSSVRAVSPSSHPRLLLSKYRLDRRPRAWIAPLATDENGLLTVKNVAAGHGVGVKIAGTEKFAPQYVALNTGEPEERARNDKTYRGLVKNLKPGEVGTLPLAPAQFFEGIVRYEDSGKPAANARLKMWASEQEGPGSAVSIWGETNEQGRFRLNPYPGVQYGIVAHPPDGAPYQIRKLNDLRWTSDDASKNIEINLVRAVQARGTIVDAKTGQPLKGASVQYYPVSARNKYLTDDAVTGWQSLRQTDEAGSFVINVLPGPGTLLVHAADGSYILAESSSVELHRGEPGGTRTYAHAFHKINPVAGQPLPPLRIELMRGGTVEGRLVDPDGQPVDHAVMISRLKIKPSSPEWRGSPDEVRGSRFQLSGLSEGVEYPVHFLDPKRKLGATAMISTKNPSPTVRLEPCGTATLKFVKHNGDPAGAGLKFAFSVVVTRGPSELDVGAHRAGLLVADEDHIFNVYGRRHFLPWPETDASGEMTVTGLIPGVRYRYTDYRKNPVVHADFVAQSGKNHDIGEFVLPNRR